MKRCFKCGIEKPLDEFYRHSRMGDGHLNKCKDCTKADVQARYVLLTSTPEGLGAERARGREKYARLYAKGANWRSPEAPFAVKRRARFTLGNAVRSGRVVKPQTCNDCGGFHAHLHGHHEDYYKPLDVAWLCPRCHRLRHAEHPEHLVQRSA